MNHVKSYIFALLSFVACNTIHTDNDQAQEILSKLVGAELCALDDTYYIALKNITKEDAIARLTPEQLQRVEATYLVVQYHLQTLCKEFLSTNNNAQAQKYVQEFELRLANNTPNINYDLQINNDFSGYELAVLDLILTQACQTAIEEQNIEALLFVLGIRCSLLQQGTQLLLASSNEQASEMRKELFQRLAHCTAMYRSLIKQLNEPQSEAQGNDNQLFDDQEITN
jgi:hypothetical protein